ncbi:MAG: hypothetical protein ACFHU9_07505 [Fluviicola sp.]
MKVLQQSNQENLTHDPNYFLELGNKAGEIGKIEESVKWYLKGLALAKELQDKPSINKLSAMIALSL